MRTCLKSLGGDVYLGSRVPRGIPGKYLHVERFIAPNAVMEERSQLLEELPNSKRILPKQLGVAWSEKLDMNTLERLFSNTQLDWDTIYLEKSKWQTIEFIKEKESGDVCLVLDNTIQLCESHNSGYSEVYTHLPIAFLSTFEKVLIVGGGDGMALQELLKYDSLKRAVQLELDPQVVEQCQKFFKINAHLPGNEERDERVEWIFGDAAKTIKDLVEGGDLFDLILLDISETDPSESVKTVDFFRSVAAALKPNGIFIKNGNYQESTSDLFDEYLEVTYPVPVIAQQTFVLGSNGTSLLLPSFKVFRENGITTHYLEDGIESGYSQYRTMVRRYSKRGLDYEQQAAKKFQDLTNRNPYDMAKEEDRSFNNEGECSDPALSPCAIEHKNHGGIVDLIDWKDTTCQVVTKERKVQIVLINSSPQPVSILWVNVETGEEMTIFKSLTPGSHKVLNTYIGHEFKFVDAEENLSILKTFEVKSQLYSHPYVEFISLDTPLIAKRKFRFSSMHKVRNAPSPSEHDEAQNELSG